MKKHFFLSATIFFLFSCSTSKLVQKGQHEQQRKHFPEYFQNVYFGMPMADFQQVKKVSINTDGLMDFRIAYSEFDLKNTNIKEATYYFDGEGDLPLYEIIIEYKTESDRDEFTDNHLGDPNYNSNTWQWDSGEGFDLYAWKFAAKIVFAGKMKNTEWEDYEF